jgi:hypothetical protein
MSTDDIRLTIVIVLIVLFFCIVGHFHTQEGEKIGTIVKVSKEGLFFKTYESKLLCGGMNNGTVSFGTDPFDFTVSDEKLISILNKAMTEQREVVIKYYKRLFSPCDSGSGGYFAESIVIK